MARAKSLAEKIALVQTAILESAAWKSVTIVGKKKITMKNSESETIELPFGFSDEIQAVRTIQLICASNLGGYFSEDYPVVKKCFNGVTYSAIHPDIYGSIWVQLESS